jgi:tetratricopeptide (TPR) repeat protein
MILVFFVLEPFLLQAQPSNFGGLSFLSPVQRGELLLSQSRNQEAADQFRSLIAEGEVDGYVFRGLIRAYLNLGELEEAKQLTADFLAENPGSPGALYGLGYIFYLSEDIDEAEEYFKQAVASDPRNALALNNWGAVLARQKSYVQAAEKVREAIQLNPSEPMFFRNLKTIYREMGGSDRILADFEYYLGQENSEVANAYGKAVARSLRQKSFQLYAQGQLDGAIDRFEEMEIIYKKIGHTSGLVPVYFSLGLLYEEKGDISKAKIFFNRVLSINTKHLQARDRLDRLQ